MTLLAGVGGVATWRRRGDNSAALVCLLVTGLGVAVLLGADLYEFSWRYQLPRWSRCLPGAPWASRRCGAGSGPSGKLTPARPQ